MSISSISNVSLSIKVNNNTSSQTIQMYEVSCIGEYLNKCYKLIRRQSINQLIEITRSDEDYDF